MTEEECTDALMSWLDVRGILQRSNMRLVASDEKRCVFSVELAIGFFNHPLGTPVILRESGQIENEDSLKRRYGELRARLDAMEQAKQPSIILDRLKQQIEVYSWGREISIEEAQNELKEFEEEWERSEDIRKVAHITSEMFEMWCLREVTHDRILEEMPFVIFELQEILQPAVDGRFDESAVDRVISRRSITGLKDIRMRALRDLTKTISINRGRNRIIEETDVEDALEILKILDQLAGTMFLPGTTYPSYETVASDAWRALDKHGFGRAEMICESIIGEAVASYGLRKLSDNTWRICKTCLKEKRIVMGDFQCSECGKWACIEHSSTMDRTICFLCAANLTMQ